MDVGLRALVPGELAAARALLGRACASADAAQVAEEKLFGVGPGDAPAAPLAAFADQELIGVAVTSSRWLRLLAVAPEHRGAGVGTALLAAAEHAVAGAHPTIRVLDQPGNYLSPGVAAEDDATRSWLERRGYRRAGERENLELAVTGNPRVTTARAAELADAARAAGYELRRAATHDRDPLLAMATAAFSPVWAFEIGRALDSQPSGVHLALADGEPVAFAAHDGNNRGLGWFGPAGTLPDHRGRGLGEALLLACLLDIAAAGHAHATIAWIGPRAFYERAAGIAATRTFIAFDKELRPS